MRSLVGAVMDAARPGSAAGQPNVPLSGRLASTLQSWVSGADRSHQLEAMTAVGTLFGIVDRLAGSVAAVDWHLYEKAAPGVDPKDRREITSHAVLDLLGDPNPFYTRQELFEAGQQHFELTGEIWLVMLVQAGLPLNVFPVRPDRMMPVPNPQTYLNGYVYMSPDGERVPLGLDEVIFLRRPSPKDPHRGISAVQSLMPDIDAAKYAAQWNRNFFLNSAEPGGIIQVPETLSDPDWTRMRERWAEQHKGVANAHRVAILEGDAQWVDRKITQKDMQFTELRGMSRDVIREAYGFPKFMLGMVDDVNRASAEASETMYARNLAVPRLDRWKQALNHDLLPRYGATARGYELDYDSPVPADEEMENAALTARSAAAVALVGAGWDAGEVLEAVGLPPMAYQRPAVTVSAPPRPGDNPVGTGYEPDGDESGVDDAVPSSRGRYTPRGTGHTSFFRHRDAAGGTGSLDEVQADWQASLDDTLSQWDSQVTPAQRQQLLDQIRTAVDRNETESLGTLACASALGASVLLAAMVALASRGSHSIADSARAAGVHDVHPVEVPEDDLRPTAVAVAAMLAAMLAVTAGREALRLATPDSTGDEVAAAVGEFLDGLSDRPLRDGLGGALTGAQNAGRFATMAAAPVFRYVAREDNDSNTCRLCREIDGHEFDTLQDARSAYPNGGYINCLGGVRCRGTVDPVWAG